MSWIADGRIDQVGTFNGNPMLMAAARVALTEILTEDAYSHFTRLREQMTAGCEEVIARHELAATLCGRVTGPSSSSS